MCGFCGTCTPRRWLGLRLCPPSALRTVVHRMAAGRVHRVYVVEPQTRRPVGIVTCTDVLRAIVALDTGG